MSLPSFQFYPGDWRNDAGLRACSLAARGLWIDLMCLMHQGTPYGYLTLPGTDITPDIETIAIQIGARHAEVKRLFEELSAKKVLEIDEKNRIFCRKMVRDEEKRSAWRERKNRQRKTDKSFNDNKADRDVTQMSREKERDVPRDVTGVVTRMSRGSSSSSSSSEPKSKDGAYAPEKARKASSPPAEPDSDPIPTSDPIPELESPTLDLTPQEPEKALEKQSTPYHFIAYWQDANQERDFGLRFEPEDGPKEFVASEVERLEITARPEEIRAALHSSFEAFRATYSRRVGRKLKNGRRKTRGSSISPQDLTEELVAWLRKDLARLAAVRARAPTRTGGLRSVDNEITESIQRARQLDQEGPERKGDGWQPTKGSLERWRD